MNNPADFSFGMLLGSAICLGVLCFVAGWLVRDQKAKRDMRAFTAAMGDGCIAQACKRLEAAIDAQQELTETKFPTQGWTPNALQ